MTADQINSDPLTVDGVVKRFGDVTAVAGISFSIQPGACFGLLGPNGAGKSHTHSQHCGPRETRFRQISIFGHPVGSAAARADLGWVPQELALYPLLTCRENLEAFGRYQGLRGKLLRRSHRAGASTGPRSPIAPARRSRLSPAA